LRRKDIDHLLLLSEGASCQRWQRLADARLTMKLLPQPRWKTLETVTISLTQNLLYLRI